ncbi:MAG: nitroreductase/quinone reductase family protein [Aggregatilineales bacterium]
MAETFLYLTTIGRVTGNPHKIEIWYVPYDACFYLCSEFPEKSDWVRNIKQDEQIMFYIAERKQNVPDKPGKATIVEDEALLTILRQKFDAKYNWSNGTFVQICPV